MQHIPSGSRLSLLKMTGSCLSSSKISSLDCSSSTSLMDGVFLRDFKKDFPDDDMPKKINITVTLLSLKMLNVSHSAFRDFFVSQGYHNSVSCGIKWKPFCCCIKTLAGGKYYLHGHSLEHGKQLNTEKCGCLWCYVYNCYVTITTILKYLIL